LIETDSIRYGVDQIHFSIARSSRRRTTCITVYPSGDVRLSVPLRTSKTQARKFIHQKAGWVVKKLREFEAQGCRDSSKKYVDGEAFPFLGHEYSLKISRGCGPIVTLGESVLNVIVPDPTDTALVKHAVFRWYKLQAEIVFREAVNIYARRLSIVPPDFKVKCQSKRWGSCTAKNLLNFNVKIVMAPLSQVNYVAAHEVCHVKIKDHSLRYWMLLESIMPNYRTAKKTLKTDGWKYEL